MALTFLIFRLSSTTSMHLYFFTYSNKKEFSLMLLDRLSIPAIKKISNPLFICFFKSLFIFCLAEQGHSHITFSNFPLSSLFFIISNMVLVLPVPIGMYNAPTLSLLNFSTGLSWCFNNSVLNSNII